MQSLGLITDEKPNRIFNLQDIEGKVFRMKDHKKIADEVFILIMMNNDPEFGLDYLALKPKLRAYFKKL